MALSKIPSKVQLPGGIVLNGVPFKIIARNPDGSPKLFELQERGYKTIHPDNCVLFADEEWIRKPDPTKVG